MLNVSEFVTIIDAINKGCEFFTRKGVDSPRLNIELILCKALRIDRVGLYSKFDRPLNNSELEAVREMTSRRGRREPLQYVLGETEFFNCKLELNPSVLIPRPETEWIVSEIIKFYSERPAPAEIMDIGVGSGCISIALALEFPESKVFGIDVSREAVDTAKANAARNGVRNVEFFKYDILKSAPLKSFDLIVSNPPYIPANEIESLDLEVKNFEPCAALTDNADGLSFYSRFASIFPAAISPGGAAFLEIGFDQASAIKDIFASNGAEIEIFKDFAGIDRMAKIIYTQK